MRDEKLDDRLGDRLCFETAAAGRVKGGVAAGAYEVDGKKGGEEEPDEWEVPSLGGPVEGVGALFW